MAQRGAAPVAGAAPAGLGVPFAWVGAAGAGGDSCCRSRTLLSVRLRDSRGHLPLPPPPRRAPRSDAPTAREEGLALPRAEPGSGSLDLIAGVGYLPAVQVRRPEGGRRGWPAVRGALQAHGLGLRSAARPEHQYLRSPINAPPCSPAPLPPAARRPTSPWWRRCRAPATAPMRCSRCPPPRCRRSSRCTGACGGRQAARPPGQPPAQRAGLGSGSLPPERVPCPRWVVG